MLQTLRDKTSGWMATVILGLLIIPFAFVGVQDYFQQSNSQAAATIRTPPAWWQSAPSWWPASVFWDEIEVTQAEFRERLEQERQQARAQQGEGFDARAFDSADNKRRILESLIDERVQQLWAQQRGLAVSDEMVRKAIMDIPAFQVDGRFDLQRYRLALASMQPARSERQFEELVRRGLEQSLVTTAVGGSNFVTPGELKRIIALLGERRDVTLLELPAPPADTAPVTAAEIDASYRANQSAYRAPETVTLEYVEMDAASMPAPAVDEAALRQRYEEEKSRFTAQEQRLASHILVEVPKDAPAAAVETARKEAAALASKARAGGDFEALARASSNDPGSAAAGGDLGWVGRGMMTGPFEQALFGMQAGQVSEPVRTDFGWHVIKLREVQAGQQQPFEQVREALAAEYLETERERAFNELSSRVVDAALKNPSSLGPAARAAGLPVRTAGPIARGQGTGIVTNPAVQRMAFSESAIQDGTISDPIEVGPNRSVILRVTGHTPARQRPLAEVRDQVAAAVRTERVRKAVEQRAKAIVARVQGGQPIDQVAAAEGLAAPRPVTGVPRGGAIAGEGVSEAIFATPVTQGQRPVSFEVLDDGRAVVFAVDRVVPGTMEELPAEQRESFKAQIASLRGYADVQAMLKEMRRGMRIEVREDAL